MREVPNLNQVSSDSGTHSEADEDASGPETGGSSKERVLY